MIGKKKMTKPKIKLGKLEKREARAGYFFILPWIIGVVAFLLFPLGMSFYFSLFRITLTPVKIIYKYVGIENFTKIWTENPEFPPQLIKYLWQTLVEVPIIVVFALIIAIMLNGKIKMRGFFRLIFFLPVIIVSGPVMNMLVSEGASSIPAMNVQSIVSAIDVFLPTKVAQGIGEIFSNIIMILWYSGVQILIFLSALQKIDRSQYEAAKIDGGSGWECFWKITLPTIKPMILLNSVYSVIFLSGNEQNEIINMIKTAMSTVTKEKGGYGYASAMAWMYSVIVTLIVLLFFLLLGSKKDVYDRKVKKYQKLQKKEIRAQKRVRRRGERHAKKVARNRNGKFTTYSGGGDY